MKLSLDELTIDSYAGQLTDNELTVVKGGTTFLVGPIIDILSNTTVTVDVYVINQNSDSGNSTTVLVNASATIYGIPIGTPPKQK